MAREKDIVVGRQGDSIVGKVLDKHFDIKSAFGQVKAPTNRITWIHFKHPPRPKHDEIWLKTGDRLTGTIRQKHVKFKAELGGTMVISRERILTIIVGGRHGRCGKSLR